jgi:hypothetical protein
MSISAVRDVLVEAGYRSRGERLRIDDLDLDVPTVVGEGSMSTLVLLWESARGYESAGRVARAVRAAIRHAEKPRPVALVVVGDDEEAVPPSLKRIIRVVYVPRSADLDGVAGALRPLLPLERPRLGVAGDGVGPQIRGEIEGTSAEALLELLLAACGSADDVEQVLLNRVSTASRPAGEASGL